MITFVCCPQCNTCRKAQKWLEDNHVAYTLRDIKTDHPTYDEPAFWHKASAPPGAMETDIKPFLHTALRAVPKGTARRAILMLCPGSGRNGGEVSEIVAFVSVGDRLWI